MGSPDADRFRILHAAFLNGDLETLRRELGSLEGFPNVIAHPAIGPCLTYAIYHSPIEMVAALLDAGADPNVPADDGFPPLIAALTCAIPAPGAAVRTDVHQLAQLLLDHGADVGQRGVNDYTPLHLAAARGDLEMVEMLLAHGADPDVITRIDDYETPLEVAAAGGRQDVVDLLRPRTPRLDWEQAARSGDVAVLRRMLRSGHDVDAIDGHGLTALMRASHEGHADAVTLLIAHDAALDHTSKFGLSALMLAVICGHSRIARVLVTAGADTTIRGTGAPGFLGKTAADLAEEHGDKRLATFIRARPTAGP
jgi:ankyrin repeat protein